MRCGAVGSTDWRTKSNRRLCSPHRCSRRDGWVTCARGIKGDQNTLSWAREGGKDVHLDWRADINRWWCGIFGSFWLCDFGWCFPLHGGSYGKSWYIHPWASIAYILHLAFDLIWFDLMAVSLSSSFLYTIRRTRSRKITPGRIWRECPSSRYESCSYDDMLMWQKQGLAMEQTFDETSTSVKKWKRTREMRPHDIFLYISIYIVGATLWHT